MLKHLWKNLNLRKFSKDDRGSIKILTAITTPFLLLMAGAGFDTAELYRARVNFQNAVDAGTLMAAKTLAATGSTSQASAAGEEVFYGNIRSIAADVADANISFNMGTGDCTSAPVVSTATLRKRVFFSFIRAATKDNSVHIDGNAQATYDEKNVLLNGRAEVKCGNDTIEIAMVLDNSGSMNSSGKIGTLRSAAANLVNTLHTTMGQGSRPNPVSFSLVPFSSMVNIGANNKNANWMDKTGVSPVHHNHFNWAQMGAIQVGNGWQDGSGQWLTRFKLYDELGINWKGCVEARPHPYHTQDDEPNTSYPETMIVPSFAPDTPDNWSGDREKILVTSSQAFCHVFHSRYYYRNGRRRERSIRYCNRWTDGYRGRNHPQNADYRPHWDDRIEYQEGNFIGDTSSTPQWIDGNVINEEWYQNNYLEDDHNFPSSLTDHPKSRANTGSGDDQYKRQKWMTKYYNNPTPRNVNNDTSGLPSVVGVEGGPNNFCLSQPITDLTPNQSAVVTAINGMQAVGATNVQAGVAWGWRTLSPEQPFNRGRSYSTQDNKKIMIVMTDGNNTAYPTNYFYNGYSNRNKSYYDAFGLGVSGRRFEGFDAISNPTDDFNTYRQAMDEHLVETCSNAKAAGISVYTIAFDVPNGSSVKTMLEECASADIGGSKLYYDAANNAQLIATFQKIAEKLSDLAIVK